MVEPIYNSKDSRVGPFLRFRLAEVTLSGRVSLQKASRQPPAPGWRPSLHRGNMAEEGLFFAYLAPTLARTRLH
jgi:hypothetical protein